MYKKIVSVPKDKLLHFSVSATLTVIIKQLLMLVVYYWMAIVITCLLMFIVGIGKEIYDKKTGKGNAEIKDIYADIFGTIIGLL